MCLVQAPPAPTPSEVSGRLPTFACGGEHFERYAVFVVQWLRFLDLFAVPAVLVFVQVTHVTFLAVLLLLSVTTVVEVNGMDGVLCLGLLQATPLDSDDDEMGERDAGSWQTVASTRKKRNKAPVVMKLKGTLASIRKGSLRQNFVDKTCIFENDMSGVEVGKALLKLSPDGINDMISTLPLGVVDRFMSLQPKFKTI